MYYFNSTDPFRENFLRQMDDLRPGGAFMPPHPLLSHPSLPGINPSVLGQPDMLAGPGPGPCQGPGAGLMPR